jgi:ferredoxin--NADP+ reductase
MGRRGPGQASFTNPELRELGELARADVIVDPADLEGIDADALEPTPRRNVEILRDYAGREPAGKTHRIEFRFFRSPLELVGEGADGEVSGLRVVRNEIVDGRAVPTDEQEVIECGLVVRSIGYRGRALPGVPFDEKRGLIRNDGGRVTGDEGDPLPGEYAVGWIKRGPSGVIGTNKKDAAETVAALIEDAEAGKLPERETSHDALPDLLSERGCHFVEYDGWRAIDALETGRGEPLGRPRVKLTSIDEMIEAARRR